MIIQTYNVTSYLENRGPGANHFKVSDWSSITGPGGGGGAAKWENHVSGFFCDRATRKLFAPEVNPQSGCCLN